MIEIFSLGLIALFAIILILVFIFAIIFWGLKYAIAYAINALIGFFALYAIKVFLMPDLAINFWSVALVAIGGIFGFALVVLLHALGIFF
jgi:hypothetical protein